MLVRLADSFLTSGRCDVAVQDSHSYAADLCHIDAIRTTRIRHAHPWLRDRFLRDDSGALVATRQCVATRTRVALAKRRMRRKRLSTWASCVPRRFLNVALDMPMAFTEGDVIRDASVVGKALQGGNVIVLPNVVFVGADSKIVAEHAHCGARGPSFERAFRARYGSDRALCLLPQILYHLDLFLLPLTETRMLVPDADDLPQRAMERLHSRLRAHNVEPCPIRHAFYVVDGEIRGGYLNGLSGRATDGTLFLVVPHYDAAGDARFRAEVEAQCAPDAVAVHFVGNAAENASDWALGAGVRCGTA